jgi:hypothetical protein
MGMLDRCRAVSSNDCCDTLAVLPTTGMLILAACLLAVLLLLLLQPAAKPFTPLVVVVSVVLLLLLLLLLLQAGLELLHCGCWLVLLDTGQPAKMVKCATKLISSQAKADALSVQAAAG